jgi:hypothetical protein
MNRFRGGAGHSVSPVERIMFSARMVGDCMVMDKKPVTGGYVQVRVDGVLKTASRIIFEQFVRPLKKGEVVSTTCRNFACVRVGHLKAQTRQQARVETVQRMRSDA